MLVNPLPLSSSSLALSRDVIKMTISQTEAVIMSSILDCAFAVASPPRAHGPFIPDFKCAIEEINDEICSLVLRIISTLYRVKGRSLAVTIFRRELYQSGRCLVACPDGNDTLIATSRPRYS